MDVCEKTKRTQCHQDGGVWSNASNNEQKGYCNGEKEKWYDKSNRCVLEQRRKYSL